MKNLTYNLYLKERIYRNETLMSYYFQPNRKIEKKCRPVDIHGERKKLYNDGVIENYKKKDIVNSYNVSVRRTKILLNMLLEMNDFDWFCTLTFDKDKIDRRNDKAVFECYKKYINNLSHKFLSLRYICVPERHEAKEDEDCGCIHFHLLIGGVPAKDLGLVNSGKVCCSWAKKKNRLGYETGGVCSKAYFEKTKHLHELKETDGETIFNITSFAYGLTTASRIVSPERCKTYVAKYIRKDIGASTEEFKKRFYYSRNLNVPEVVKKLVGAEFDEPVDLKLEHVVGVDDSPYIDFAKGRPYISDYNVLQLKIDNEIKNMLDKGLIPTEENINQVFNNQMSIENLISKEKE